MKKQSTNSVIPEGELRCVWMDAGVAEFKLCDQELRCETCTFNLNVIQQNREMASPYAPQQTKHSDDGSALTADALFHNALKKRLEYLHAIPYPAIEYTAADNFGFSKMHRATIDSGLIISSRTLSSRS